jgi:hypothetical protein
MDDLTDRWSLKSDLTSDFCLLLLRPADRKDRRGASPSSLRAACGASRSGRSFPSDVAIGARRMAITPKLNRGFSRKVPS